MVTLVVVCCGLLSALPADAGGPAPDLAAYEAAYRDAKAKVGRDADAHVRLALWCEARGLHAERLKHLAIAALIEPGHATARGLMGLVADAGGWKRPEAVAQRDKADTRLAALLEEYRARRDRTPMKADDQWKLALWCAENGLEAEAKAHLTLVTRIDPDHAAARKRLGYKKQGGRWTTAAQLAEEKGEAEREKKADRVWKPRLERWRDMLAGKDEGKRAEAKRASLEVTDPRAVPAIWAVFGHGTVARQTVAVQLLGQIDGPLASRALVTLAVFSPAADVRQIAIQTLARRDPRDFVGLLVDRVRDPIKYEVRPVGGPGSPGVLFVEGKRYDVRRTYGTPAVHPLARNRPRIFAPWVPFDPFSMQNIATVNGMVSMSSAGLSSQALQGIAANPRNAPMILAQGQNQWVTIPSSRASSGSSMFGWDGNSSIDDPYRQATAAAARRDWELAVIANDIQVSTLNAQQRLNNDVRSLELIISAIKDMNGRLLPVLEGVTCQRFGEDSASWQAWWTDQEGYAVAQGADQKGHGLAPDGRPYKPVIDQFITVPFQLASTSSGRHTACFGAGTTVRTRAGSQSIETIKVGDQLLAQDTHNGALSFQPVLAVFHNPPNQTLRISLGDDAIVATGIHRFWKAGHGWIMARDLKAGDTLRSLAGVVRVTAVETAGVQPVFNLEMAGIHNFFVGPQDALVHDNSLVQPTPEPFDAAPDLAGVVRSASDRGVTP